MAAAATTAAVVAATTSGQLSLPAHLQPHALSHTVTRVSPSSVIANTRVIMHVDMDCFYAQVERERFPHWRDHQIGVVQNGSLVVTCNYHARTLGAPKMGGVEQTKRVCPQILFAGSDMKRYRRAAKQWLTVFESYGCIVQKKSIDEALLDLTDIARHRLSIGDLRTIVAHPRPDDIITNRNARMDRARDAMTVTHDNEVWADEHESSGSVRASIFASRSSDPLTAIQDSYRYQRLPTVAQSAVTAATNGIVTAPVVPSRRAGQYQSYADMRADKTFTDEQKRVRAMTPDQFAVHIAQLHCIDHCRATRSHAAPVALAPVPLSSSSLSSSSSSSIVADDSSSLFDSASSSSSQSLLLDQLVEELEHDEKTAAPSSSSSSSASLECWVGTVLCNNEYPAIPSDRVVAAVAAYAAGRLDEAASLCAIDDLLLIIGSQIAFEIRSSLFDQYGYTTSAGVAHSPMMAKIASSTNKPNQQSIVRRTISPMVLHPLAIRKIPGFGAKSEAIVTAKGLTTIAQLQQHTLSQLCATFGDDMGQWLDNIAHARDDTIVAAHSAPKQLGHEKRQILRTMQEKLSLLEWLATQLWNRMQDDEDEYKRRPSTIVLRYHTSGHGSFTRRQPLSWLKDVSDPIQHLHDIASSLLHKHVPSTMALSCMGLSVGSFVSLDSTKSITTFFKQKHDSPTTHASSLLSSISPSQTLSSSSSSSSSCIAPQLSSPHRASRVTSSVTSSSSSSSNRKRSRAPTQSASQSIFLSTPSAAPSSSSSSSSSSGDSKADSSVSSSIGAGHSVPLTSDIPSIVTFVCDRCHTSISDGRQQHDDWHMAQDVQKQLREADSIQAAHDASEAAKRRKLAKQPIARFFQSSQSSSSSSAGGKQSSAKPKVSSSQPNPRTISSSSSSAATRLTSSSLSSLSSSGGIASFFGAKPS